MARKQLIQREGESDKAFQNRLRIRRAQHAYVDRNRELINQKNSSRNKAWRLENPELSKEDSRRKYANNRVARYASHRKWVAANPEKVRDLEKKQRAKDPAKWLMALARRRDAVRRATPAWADLVAIKAIYEEAINTTQRTGIPHVVDHYYPLRGRMVCGLHVENNLRVITHAENAWKLNRMPDEPPSVAGPFIG